MIFRPPPRSGRPASHPPIPQGTGRARAPCRLRRTGCNSPASPRRGQRAPPRLKGSLSPRISQSHGFCLGHRGNAVRIDSRPFQRGLRYRSFRHAEGWRGGRRTDRDHRLDAEIGPRRGGSHRPLRTGHAQRFGRPCRETAAKAIDEDDVTCCEKTCSALPSGGADGSADPTAFDGPPRLKGPSASEIDSCRTTVTNGETACIASMLSPLADGDEGAGAGGFALGIEANGEGESAAAWRVSTLPDAGTVGEPAEASIDS